jgi:hypothetical protein
VHAEVLTTTGAEELEVGRREDGTIELEFVGEDSEAAGGDLAKADGPGECSDPEYTLGERRLSSALRYRFNRATTPSELRPGDAADAIRRGGTRVANTKSNCRMGDRVLVGLVYEGKTGQGTNIDGLSCGDNDGNSVVAFGELPGGVWQLPATGADTTAPSPRTSRSTNRVSGGRRAPVPGLARGCGISRAS